MVNLEKEEVVVRVENGLDGVPDDTETEKIVARAGNKLRSVPDEVRATLEGLRTLMKALVSVGQEGLMTTDVEMKSFDTLIERLYSIFADPDTVDKLNFFYDKTLNLEIIIVKRRLGSVAFSNFLHSLGTIETLYQFAPLDPETPEDPTLTVVGFGSTFGY